MSDEVVEDGGAAPVEQSEDDAIAAEVATLTAVEEPAGKQSKLVAGVIAREKEIRALKKELNALKPVAARASEVNERLERAQPFIDAIVNSPQLRAQALRAVQGTRASAETTEQPDHDTEAAEWAELHNLYLPDGQTLDVARAQRSMALMDKRNGRQTDERIRPLAGVTLGQKADHHLQQAIAMTDDEGVPLASEQSIRETWGILPANLLADPKVVEIALNNAIGLDRRARRTPKAPVEPMYLERAGGRRRGNENAISPDLKARAERLGLSEKDLQEASTSLSTGKAITFGSK